MKVIKGPHDALVDTLHQQQVVIYIDPASDTPAAHCSTAQSAGWDGETLTLDSGDRTRNGSVLHAASERYPLDRPNQQFMRCYGFSHICPACEIFSIDA